MYILGVIPIQKGFLSEELTYFSSKEVDIGMIVRIPVRNKIINAIVVSSQSLIDLKGDIKKREYQIKKIISVKGKSPFSRNFFNTCEKIKDYYLSTTGNIIKSMLPSVLLDNIELLNESKPELYHKDYNLKQEKLIFQASNEDRLTYYKTQIRESFARKESVYICLPTRFDIENYKIELSRGISDYVYCFDSTINKKKLIETYNECISNEHPVLIIGTGKYLSIPRHDIKVIIIENENRDSYKQMIRPYIDIRTFVEVYTSFYKIKLIFGDSLLRPETLYRNEIGELGEVYPPLFRLPKVERKIIIDMEEGLNNKKVKEFQIISESVKSMISYGLENKESIILFTVRKGLAGTTICSDCGISVLCNDCSSPLVLYESKKSVSEDVIIKRVFMCNKCGKKDTVEQRCKNCQSWNLYPLGIGTDRVYSVVKNLFPNAKIFQIDKETVLNEKDTIRIIDEFYNNKGSILIGTEMIFSYLDKTVTHGALISFDGLLSIPSYNITQKILFIIKKLSESISRNLVIQTRILENQILEHILNGNILPLYREDIKDREKYGYPPFKKLIKISFTGTAKETALAKENIDRLLGHYEPQVFSAFTGKTRGVYTTNTVLKVDNNDWPLLLNEKNILNNNLLNNLKKLPPTYNINVDPENLL